MSSIKTRRERTMVLGTARPGTGLDTQPRELPQPGDLSIQYARRASRQAGESNLIVERNTSETRVAKRWRRKAKAPVRRRYSAKYARNSSWVRACPLSAYLATYGENSGYKRDSGHLPCRVVFMKFPISRSSKISYLSAVTSDCRGASKVTPRLKFRREIAMAWSRPPTRRFT